jgi:glutamate---cysteine ligase / carboxylate-amine ligase
MPIDLDELRARFEHGTEYSVGIEEEVMVLDPKTFALADRSAAVLELLGGDPRFKPELPASQIEIMIPPHRTVREAAGPLLQARRELLARAGDAARFAAAGFHPFSPAVGGLSPGARYRAIEEDYRCLARRELVCALQVHVFVGDAERALSVYNAARSYLPLVAALAANAPFYEGADTGLASIRPEVAGLLPRQGVPPAIRDWEQYADVLAWGSSTGTFAEAAQWWWELRPHPEFGTLEFRVPDAQSTVEHAAGIAAVIQTLVAWLGSRHDGGEVLAVHPRWMIEENRWLACRDGVAGELVDLQTGRRRRTRDLLVALFGELLRTARDLDAGLAAAERMVERNGAIEQRAVAHEGGPEAVAAWLADRFIEPYSG